MPPSKISPALLVALSFSCSTPAPSPPPGSPSPPVEARFVDLPADLPVAACRQVLLAVVSGEASVGGERLAAGDTALLVSPAGGRAEGAGVAVLVEHREALRGCTAEARPAPTTRVIRGAETPPLTWAKGSMTAWLDVPGEAAPGLYLGRLAGSAPVKEHDHAGSWEILCAVEASGTFILDGVQARLGRRQVVVIPPGKKHAWLPDEGTRLVGVQLYTPPGPEQRFKALAAEAAPAPR
jgi:quercetin dioxygenase-like cupin family protein